MEWAPCTDEIACLKSTLGDLKMKFKIIYRAYAYSGRHPQLDEYLREIDARSFCTKDGFVQVWTERNETEIPSMIVNANDLIMIEPIDDDEN